MMNRDKRQATSDKRRGKRNGVSVAFLFSVILSGLAGVTCFLSPVSRLLIAEGAVSTGKDRQLQAADTNQGGGALSSTNFRQQSSIGSAISSNQMTSSRFRVVSGFIGASLSASTSAVPVSELDMKVLHAKSDPLGVELTERTWQKVSSPLFLWEPPTGPEVAGYSYAMDSSPDNIIDTTSTSFDVATSFLQKLTDGKHTFSVKAINSAGTAGKPISFELWIDTSPPQITAYSPSPGTLLNTLSPTVNATITDVGSGVDKTRLNLLLNGASIPVVYNETTGVVTATGGTWREGANSLELRVADVIGNAPASLIWSVTLDTKPPTGTVTLNGGAKMTTSVHVTLNVSASDAISGVARMMISNDELTGYVEEPFASVRELWKLNAIRGKQKVYVKFVDRAGNVSAPISAEIDLGLLSPETVITSGPAGFSPDRNATFTFMCPEGNCVFSFAVDNGPWSDWNPATTAIAKELPFGNHYFRVKAAKEANGLEGIQPDEEDPSPAERTWVVGVEPPVLIVPQGPAIKMWRLE